MHLTGSEFYLVIKFCTQKIFVSVVQNLRTSTENVCLHSDWFFVDISCEEENIEDPVVQRRVRVSFAK